MSSCGPQKRAHLEGIERVLGFDDYPEICKSGRVGRWLFNKMNNLLSQRNEKTIVEIGSLYFTSKLQLNIES